MKMAARLDIRLFGHVAMTYDGRPWRYSGSARATAVLGYLIVRAGEPVSRSALAALMWPDDDVETGRAKLRRQLYQLARALPPGIEWAEMNATTVRWISSPDVCVDAIEFERAAADPSRVAEAIELYRGEFLENSYEDWALHARERYQSEFLRLCYDAAQAARRARDFDAMLVYADRILGVDEWREDALRLEMTARYESGDRTGALAAFERFCAKLRREMNVDPMPETVALRAAILQGSPLPGRFDAVDDELRPAGGAPFVGRSAELEALGAAWLRAARGRGSTVFVGGEAGIGKTRLVGELAAQVAAQGGRVMFGGTSNPEAFPFEAIVDALRGGIALLAGSNVDAAALAALGTLLPELRGLVPDLPVPDGTDARARTRLLEAVARAVERLAHARPLLLVIEDAHWAGHATLDALEAIARRVGAQPVLVVVTYRAEEAGAAHPLRAIRKRLQEERRAASIALGALPRDQIEHLVRAQDADASESLCERLCELSDGNPLFVVHLLRGFAETGELPSADLPSGSLRAALAGRVAALDEPARVLAETAAVAGRSFTIEIIAQVLGWAEHDVAERLGTLLERGIVREAGAARLLYTFTHALIAATIYEATPPERRALRHRRIAQIASQTPEGRAEPATVARHWSACGDRERAYAWYLHAARAALDVYAREEGAAFAREAAEYARGDAEAFEALALSAAALERASDAAQWNDALCALERVAERLGERERLTVLRLRASYANQVSDVAACRAIAGEMLAIAQAIGDEAGVVDAQIMLGILQTRLVDLESAIGVLREALERAIALGDEERAMSARERLAQPLLRTGDLAAARVVLAAQRAAIERNGASAERRLQLLNPESLVAQQVEDGPALERIGAEMLSVAREIGDVLFEARAHTVLAHRAYIDRNYDAMLAHYDRARELFERLGDSRSTFVTYMNMTEMALRLGRAAWALALMARAEPWLDRSMPDSMCALHVNRAKALLLLGRGEEARAAALEAEEAGAQTREVRLHSETQLVLAQCEVATGCVPEAMERIERVLGDAFVAREDWHNESDALCLLIETALDAGEAERVRGRAAELERLFREHPDAVVHAERICAALARLAEANGDSKAAAAYRTRARAHLAQALAKIPAPEDAALYAALPFNAVIDRRPDAGAATGNSARRDRAARSATAGSV